ncbi:MAG TPA: hypothetical protein VK772_13160 [Puia sp.]|nr:hypothetical protein [Puia sp.]
MKIFNLFQTGNSVPGCQHCKYFQNDPSIIEKEYPGLKVMSSGFASVRDRDGFCNYNQIYLSARDGCSKFVLERSTGK